MGLKSCGFQLSNEDDALLWSWNGKNGGITAKLAYDAL